jgi:hypothetical protein
MANAQTPFHGPLFIVGLPRSGTKLMRALLNQHPRVSLTLAESQFIPYFVRVFGEEPRLQEPRRLARFVKRFRRATFYQTMQKAGYQFDEQTFVETVDLNSWPAIFEGLFRQFGAKPHRSDVIWGDKTPGYLKHLAWLKGLFPAAKFIHMIRDPRDYCLSVRDSWGKHPLRAAHRWQKALRKARDEATLLQDDYLEVYYEALVTRPEDVMREVSALIGCTYDQRMIVLGRSPEDLGSTRGQYGIIAANTQKYLTRFSPRDLRQIEQIVCDTAEPRYRCANAARARPLNRYWLFYYKLYDGVASLRYHMSKQQSVVEGARRLIRHYRQSGWR